MHKAVRKRALRDSLA